MNNLDELVKTIHGRGWAASVILFVATTLLETILHLRSLRSIQHYLFVSAAVGAIDALLVSLVSVTMMALIYLALTKATGIRANFSLIWRITLVSALPVVLLGGLAKADLFGLSVMGAYVVVMFKLIGQNTTWTRTTIMGLPVLASMVMVVIVGHPHYV